VDESTGSTTEHPVNVQLDVSAAFAPTVLSLQAQDARFAEAMRAAHNPTLSAQHNMYRVLLQGGRIKIH